MKPTSAHSSSRRNFLNRSAAGTGTALLAPWGVNLTLISAAAAASDDYKALVCLFLDGGNDQDNTLIPYDEASHARYAAVRGAGATPIGVTRDALITTVLRSSQPLAGGRHYALHPNMGALARLFAQGQAAVLFNVGPLVVPLTRAQYRIDGTRYPLPPKLFSHSDQKAVFESARPEGAGIGYGGRMIDPLRAANQTPALSSISVASGNPLFLFGAQSSPYQMTVRGSVAITPAAVERGPTSSMVTELIQQRSRHVLEDTYAQITRLSMATNTVVSSALGGYRPPDGVSQLTQRLRLVAQVAAARQQLGTQRQVFFVRQFGYDTHAGQTGRHPGLLQDLSEAIGDFQATLQATGLADKVTLFTASDFGRTLTNNGDGTDHGWGNHHFIVGGAVKGNQFYGKPPPVSVGDSDAAEDQWHVGQGRLLPSTSVAQYMATLARWLGVPADQLAQVIPDLGNFGAAAGRPDYPIDLGFMR